MRFTMTLNQRTLEAGFDFTRVMRGPWRRFMNFFDFRLPSIRREIPQARQPT